jgi:hypothetical protein
LFLCTKIFTKIIRLSYNYIIKIRIKKINNNLECILINNIDLYQYFTRSFNLLTTNFTLDLLAIDKAIAKLLELIKNFNIDFNFN